MTQMASYTEALRVAREADNKLTAYDFHCDNLVVVLHEEGTQLMFRSAFLKKWMDWVFIFTEHHNTLVYHKDDLHSYAQYTQKEIERLKDTLYVDICCECNQTFNVEELQYTFHPERFEEQCVICDECYKKEYD